MRDTLYFCVTVSFVSWSRTPLDDAQNVLQLSTKNTMARLYEFILYRLAIGIVNNRINDCFYFQLIRKVYINNMLKLLRNKSSKYQVKQDT